MLVVLGCVSSTRCRRRRRTLRREGRSSVGPFALCVFSLPLSSSLCALGARVFSYVFCRSIAVFSAAKTLSRSLLADVVIVTSFFSFSSCLRLCFVFSLVGVDRYSVSHFRHNFSLFGSLGSLEQRRLGGENSSQTPECKSPSRFLFWR